MIWTVETQTHTYMQHGTKQNTQKPCPFSSWTVHIGCRVKCECVSFVCVLQRYKSIYYIGNFKLLFIPFCQLSILGFCVTHTQTREKIAAHLLFAAFIPPQQMALKFVFFPEKICFGAENVWLTKLTKKKPNALCWNGCYRIVVTVLIDFAHGKNWTHQHLAHARTLLKQTTVCFRN